MLTKKQIKQIESIIRKRFLAFTYEAVGEHALTSEEIEELKNAGLLKESVRSLTADGYTLGKILALMPPKERESFSFEEVLKHAKKMTPTTGVEKEAIKWASEKAGQYITGIGDKLAIEVRSAGARTAESALRAVQDEVSEAILNRKTTSELKTALFHAIDDANRDWQRVASTEMADSIQRGIYAEIRNNSEDGTDALIYKLVNPDACKYCRKLFLKDGVPIVFRLKDLADSNYGLKASAWRPTIGPVHPHCGCTTVPIPKGYSFVTDESGETTLSYTGKTAHPTTEKSMDYESDTDDENEYFRY